MEGLILILEDEIAGEYQKRYLERRGYLVMHFENGREGLEAIRDGLKYKIAFIDLSLPFVDGTEVIRVSKEVNPKVPVVSMSGYLYTPNGVDFHLEKPFSPDRLTDILDKCGFEPARTK